MPDDVDSDDGSGDGELQDGDASHASDDGASEEPQPEQVVGGKRWLTAWRWGWATEAWKPFLEKLAPSVAVLCSSMHLQPGLLMSVLSYNDARFGLDRCHLFAFYPRDCGVQEEGVQASQKHLEQGHLADHVLERVSTVYADFRVTANRSARKRQLSRKASAENAGKRAHGQEAPAPGPELPAGSSAAGSQEAPAGNAAAGAGPSPGIKATMFIAVLNNAGPKSSLMPLPLERSAEDSDADECGGDASNMTHIVVSKRNCNMMAKHKLKIQKSTGPEGTGNGLFAAEALAMGTTIPCKGIWFNSIGELDVWLGEQHPRTAEAMARKIIEVNFSQQPSGEKTSKYLVMTSVVGYVNAYTNITQRPNAQLVFNPDRPLGQYSVVLKLTQDLCAGKEILVAYGSKHMVRERKPRGPKTKKPRREGQED